MFEPRNNLVCFFICHPMYLNLSYDGGRGALCAPHSLFIFLLKISPPDQTLRPNCKFLILGIFYHAKKHLVYKKFYYINSLNFLKLMGGPKVSPPPPFLFMKTIEKVIRLCTVLNFFFWVVVLKIGQFFTFLNLVMIGGGGLMWPFNIDR